MRAVERWNRLHPNESPRRSHVASCLAGDAPVIAASDYVRAYPGLIASYVEARFVILGTDGFGRSDTRSKLRAFFEIDRRHIAIAALDALVLDGRLQRDILIEAIARYEIDPDREAPWTS
jgi:pyruvate dehydrogenase E1 component